jgi:dTDP-4-dehydrorhamnose reductase
LPDDACFCIIGGDSSIGAALRARLLLSNARVLSSTRRADFDQKGKFHLDLQRLDAFRLPEACDVIIIAAAMTKLGDCRARPSLAREANLDAPVAIAKRAFDRGATVVFLSTNQVFDGCTPRPRPEDQKSPRSMYGLLKAEAEDQLGKLGGDLAIVRLGKVITPELALFQTWRNELSAGRSIKAFDDLKMAPISISRVITGLERITHDRLKGTFHLNCEQEITFLDAARHIAKFIGCDVRQVISASAAEAGIPEEERPEFVALAPGSLETSLGLSCSNAEAELRAGLALF